VRLPVKKWEGSHGRWPKFRLPGEGVQWRSRTFSFEDDDLLSKWEHLKRSRRSREKEDAGRSK
jgi:hypothetical protein